MNRYALFKKQSEVAIAGASSPAVLGSSPEMPVQES